MLKLFRKLIEARRLDWGPQLTRDPLQEKLLDNIAAKTGKGRRTSAKPKAAPKSDNVVSLFTALQKSIAAEKDREK